MKIFNFIFAFLFLAGMAHAQQLDFTCGLQQSGSAYSGAGLVYIDTTGGTTNDIYVDLVDYYPFGDLYPAIVTDTITVAAGGDSTMAGSLYDNSTRQYIGTFYVYFDNQGASAATDSLAGYTIKVTPGCYMTASRSIASAKFGTAVTLETVRQVGDYLAINNVYIHASKGKLFPPEIIKLQINAPATSDADLDDSTAVNWRFVYPEVYHPEQIQIQKDD